MALADIYRDLHDSISNQQIDLYQAAQQKPSLVSLRAVLALFNITSSYVLTNVQLTQPEAVILTGRGTWALKDATVQSHVAASLVVTAPGGVALFRLSLSITDTNWTFSTTFQNLPQTQVFVDETRTVEFVDSFLKNLALVTPVLSAKNKISLVDSDEMLHLMGSLYATGPLAPYEALFAPWPLTLEGTVTLPATANDLPAMDLTAIAPSLVFNILNVSLSNVGLNFVVVNDLDPDESIWDSLSFINVVASLDFGTIHGDAMAVLLASSRELWRFLVTFDPPLGVGQSLAQIAALLDVAPEILVTPQGFDDWSGFGITEIDFLIGAPTGSGIVPSVENVAITLSSSKQWNPPIPFVRVRDVGTHWIVGWVPIGGQNSHYLSGSIYGTVWIGNEPPSSGPVTALSDPDPLPLGEGFSVDIIAYIPQFVISGSLRTDDSIPIGDAFRYFFGGPGPTTKEGMRITAFNFLADPQARTFDASAVITMDWNVPLLGTVSIALQSLRFRISATQDSIGGAILGEFALRGMQVEVVPRFYVGAEYTGSESTDGWIFRGGLYPDTTVDLVSLVFNFINVTPPASLPSVQLEALDAEFATKSQRYHVAGKVAGRWTLTLFGNELNISATAAVDIQRAAGAPQAEGKLVGRFAINKIAVEVGINLSVNEPTYTFRIEFDQIWFSAITGWHGEAPKRHQIITLQLGGVTLGAILEYLVNLAAPTIGYKLEPPWDILNRIDLSRFRLTIDPTEDSISLIYDANVDLTIMRIDSIGVRYQRGNGESTVNLLLFGQFLGKQYTTQPLSWDVINDPPPSIGAGGDSLLVVRYLGVGQRITPRTALPDTVRGTLDLLAQAMKPPEDPSLNPLQQPSGQGLRFAADSEWLIGIDLTLLDTVDLGVVFNDPRLYGLSIGLRGERAGPLAGLRFEILYKKITNDVGMFRIELRLPEAFRHFEFGEVSITLGVIVVEIYTNGNFLIDFGFPYDRNYDRSFTIQVFPFIGRGGIYFGVLDGNTSRRVPRITNGTFAPVLELGVGLAVGVGKEITVGPLSGGIYVELEVIFQGVFAWFNPASSAVAPAKYYLAQGIVAIHGKVYGSVDFGVIKASVTIEAYAQASVVFEAYRPTVFRLDVGVSVEAEVEILFVSVSFSFEAHLDVSFTIGRELPTPWALGEGQSQSRLGQLNILPPLSSRPNLRIQLLTQQHLALLLSEPASLNDPDDPCANYVLSWNPTLAVFASSRPIALTMLPVFSLTQVPVNWDNTQPVNPNPQYRTAFVLFAPNGVTPHATPEQRVRRSADLSAQATDTIELSADILVEALLRWSIAAVAGSPGNDPTKVVTAGQVATLLSQLACPQTREAFSIINLAQFLKTNAPLRISGDPDGPSPLRYGGMVFPMPPPISWTSSQAGNRNFAEENKIGPLYEWGIATYLAKYFPQETPVGPQPPDDPTKYESFASYVFRDYFLMVTKGAVQAAQDALRKWTVKLTTNSSPAIIANGFPAATVSYGVRAGDTVDSVASALGATPSELEFLNPTLAADLAVAAPGTSLQIKLGVSPQSVVIDNATVTLTSNLTFALGTIDYAVSSADTLNSIAQHFHLANAAALLAGTSNADNPQLLKPLATFPSPSVTYTPASGATTMIVAATFYIRYFAPSDVPFTEWYGQTIFDLNQDGTLSNVDGDNPIPPGLTLLVPPALERPARSDAIAYTTVIGDTVTQVAAALSLAQNFSTGQQPSQSWAQFRDAVTTGAGTVVLPAATVTIRARDTLNSLATRTIVNAGQTAQLLGWLADSQVLQPLAIVSVPDIAAISGRDGNTLSDLAAYYDLSIAELGSRLATQTVFTASQSLVLRNLLVLSIDRLVANVLAGDALAQISATTSRYLFSGLRLAAPEDAGGHKVASGSLTALYDLTEQQFASPAPSVPGVALQVTVTLNAGTDWIELVNSTVVEEGETLDALLARVPVDSRLNPGLRSERIRPGIIVFTGTVSQLVFSYTGAQLQYPATGLALDPKFGPAPLALAGYNPRTYGLDHRIALQTGQTLPIPIIGATPAAGIASLWPFAGDLIARALSRTATPYDILRSKHGESDVQADAVQSATFATLLSFQVRRQAGRDHLYDVIGAATDERQSLLTVWQYLTKQSTPPGSRCFLLSSQAPDANNASGLITLSIDNASTFIIKTNLSTATVLGPSGNSERSFATFGDYYASFADLAPFLLLLWEASIVGGSGYYLNLKLNNGNDIPASAFADGDLATVYLLMIAGEQQAAAPAGRTLLPINNCAAVGPGLDPSVHTLYVEAAVDAADERTVVATVPPGNVGFTLSLPIPATTSAEDQLRALFSLATYQTPVGDAFTMSPSGLPVSPQRDDGQRLPLWQRRRRERWQRLGRTSEAVTSPAEWRLDQVLPIARFGPPSVAPLVTGLPNPLNDPYRGIGAASLASANIQLGFADVVGNVTAPPVTASGIVDAKVGYTDPLMGVSNWPAVTMNYQVAANPDQSVTMTVEVAPQPSAIVAAPGQSAAGAIEAAARQAEKYREPYFQLIQPGVTAAVVTTLKPSPVNVDLPLLWRFSAANYIAAQNAANVIPKIANGKLSDVAVLYGVTYDEIASANGGEAVASLFGSGSLSVPVFLTFADGETANSIVQGLAQGWPNPGTGVALLTQNSTLPLRTETALQIPSTALVIPQTVVTLGAFAADHGTTAPLLARDSKDDRDILQLNFTFEFNGLSVKVGQTTIPPQNTVVNTFGDVVAAFAAIGVNLQVEDLGAAYAGAPNMLAAGKTIHTAHYVAIDGESLQHNRSGATAAQLASSNVDTPNVFDAGAVVYLGSLTGTTGGPAETLQQFANRYACPPAQLIAANADLVLPANTTLVVPGTVALPGDTSSIRVPYAIGSGESLNQIAAKFLGASAQSLGDTNRYLPGTLAGGQTVTVGAFSTPTTPGDSFDSVWKRLTQQSSAIQFAEVITAIAATGSYLNDQGLLICPPAKVAAGANLTFDQIPGIYHVSALAFMQANAALLGVIANNVVLSNTDGSVSIHTGANDTFNSILSRFAQVGVSITLQQIATKNHDVPLILAGALALLPPTPAELHASLGNSVGPFASPIVPLTVALRLQRPAAVISPEFRTQNHDGPVERADAIVPARTQSQDRGVDQEITLAAFVQAFQLAFGYLRVATGKVREATADLFVVDFSNNGITKVKVAPAVPRPNNVFWPRFFALRPLYNSLVQRPGVPIQQLNSNGNLDPQSKLNEFQNVDVEVWAQRFLSDVDLFLTAPYAASIYANANARAALDQVLNAKKNLARAVARGLWPTLVITDAKAAAGRLAAIESLKQQLEVNLSRVGDLAALVQYDSTVNSPWTRGAQLRAARLGGAVVPQPQESSSDDDPDQILPYSMVGAKTRLDQASSFVTFFMQVSDPQHHGAIQVNPHYDFLELEFNVTTVENVQGYETSDWISFVDRLTNGIPPAVQTDLGVATVPIPLRNYPGLPTISGQAARATWCDTHPCDNSAEPPLDQTILWTYGLSYSHEHAEQDEVQILVTFNIVALPQTEFFEDNDDVATYLAKYIAVADPLWAILSDFANPAPTISPATLANAATTFATFVSNIGLAWGSHWPEPIVAPESRPKSSKVVSSAPAPEEYSFRVRISYSVFEGKSYFFSLQLKKDQVQTGPSGQWPDVYYAPPSGDAVKLAPGTPHGDTLIYLFPTQPKIEAVDWPHITIEWLGINIAAKQNARATLAVRRNIKLLGEENPDTASAFVFQTGTIQAADIVTPLLSWSQRIALVGSTTTQAIQNALTTLFGTMTGLPLTISIFYAYQLVNATGDGDGITIYLPVSIYPNQPLGSGTAGAVAAALQSWDDRYHPTREGGEWGLALTLYSQVDSVTTRPLLVLERMKYPIAESASKAG